MAQNFLNFDQLTPKDQKLFYGELIYKANPLALSTQKSKDSVEEKPEQNIHFGKGLASFAAKIKPLDWLQKRVIRENNRKKLVWDIFVMILIIFSSFTTAYLLAFGISPTFNPGFLAFDIITQICFTLDIILTFMHEYRDPRSFECISELKLIAKNYLKSWFIIDFLATLPFQYSSQGIIAFRLFRIFRIPRILRFLDFAKTEKLMSALVARISSKNKIKYMFLIKFGYKVLRSVMIATMLTYFLGCLWYFIVKTTAENSDEKNNFCDNYNLDQYSNFRVIIICCYFILTILTTVGYGDFYPINQTERLLGILIMILGIALFSYIISTFNDVVSSYDTLLGLEDKSTSLHNWISSLKKKNGFSIPNELIEQIYEHFQFFWKNDRLSNLTPDDKFFSQIPKPLQHDLIQYLFCDIFALFRGFFFIHEFRQSPFYDEIAFEFLPCKYNFGQHILQRGDCVNEIYLVKEGTVFVYFEYQGKKIGKLFGEGYFFGNYNIFWNTTSQWNYKAMKSAEPFHTCTKVITISKSKLLKYLSRYPEILARMMESSKANSQSTAEMMKHQLKLELKKDNPSMTNEEVSDTFKELFVEKEIDKIDSSISGTEFVDSKELKQALKSLQKKEAKVSDQLNRVTQSGKEINSELETILSMLKEVKHKISDHKNFM